MEDRRVEFEALVAAYERRIYNVLLRMVSDPEEAADLTQETFVKAYKSFDRFRAESQPYTWIYRIAVNSAKDSLNSRKRRHAKEIETSRLEASMPLSAWEPTDQSESPDERLLRQELSAQIERAIDQMPTDYREVIILREYQGLSYEQVAEALDTTLESVRSRLARARAWLRQRLSSYIEP
ncbi:MAG: sigma-70 family RNA polymerase sigma factor [Armatimonadetes bacterium]|nr:sigma-70 family RNA polymerase sigma factor [Armatimonadota bacterium]